MSALWQLTLLWGVVIGAATGCLSSPLAAVVATRWFVRRRGLVTGVLSAAYATGQLIFLPVLAVLVRDAGWRWASAAVAISAAAAVPVAVALLRERPADLGIPPYGAEEVEPPAAAGGNPFAATAAGLVVGLRSRAFWLLAGTFFVCGATTVGVIGTHLIPAAHDHGIGEVQAAGLLAAIGVFDILGVTASGWLTDRWDARQLLFAFYALRGLSLFFLPFVLGTSEAGLAAFVVVFGLDWVATVPPTVALTVEAFGRERAGVIFGWIFAAHQLGAAAAAWAAGAVRAAAESYEVAFMGAGLLGVGRGLHGAGRARAPWRATERPRGPEGALCRFVTAGPRPTWTASPGRAPTPRGAMRTRRKLATGTGPPVPASQWTPMPTGRALTARWPRD